MILGNRFIYSDLSTCSDVCVCVCLYCAGNSGGQFSIDLLSGLITRGPRTLDRETSSSHLLEVEAYNSDQGSMRSSVRVRCVAFRVCVCEMCLFVCAMCDY